MNTTARRLTPIVMIAAVVAAAIMIQPAKAAPADAGTPAAKQANAVVTLPRVIVTGKHVQREQIVYLPRVVVTGRRADSRNTTQARKDNGRAAVVAMR